MQPLIPVRSEHATEALVIFALTYAVMGFGSLPSLRIDRTGAALIGATAMVAFGVLAPHEALVAIDFHTLALLLGMMILVAHLKLAGFFGWMGSRLMREAGNPRRMLVLTVWLSGLVSALFVNDTACLLLTPLVLEVAIAMRRNPVPYLLAVAMGSNLGSVATIVGNPQNMLVASFSRISYARFLIVLLPVAVAGLALGGFLLSWLFRRDLAGDAELPVTERAPTLDRPLLIKSLVVTVVLLVALIAGVTPSLCALIAASALLITRRLDPHAVYAQVDWSLLLMFSGLFVVVEGFERTGLSTRGLAALPPGSRQSIVTFAAVITTLGNLVGNVPAVLLLKSWASELAKPERAWLVLAMTSTLAGNLTLVGSVANLIVVEKARGQAQVSFWAYARVGVPLTIATLALGLAWVTWVVR